MTSLLILSDLHLEHRPAWSLAEIFSPFDVAVFTGDVDGSPERAVRSLAEAPGLAGRPIVCVPGNHEYYHGFLDERLAVGKAAAVGTRVHLLDRGTVLLAGVRFVGAMLWTDDALFGDPKAAMDVCRRTAGGADWLTKPIWLRTILYLSAARRAVRRRYILQAVATRVMMSKSARLHTSHRSSNRLVKPIFPAAPTRG